MLGIWEATIAGLRGIRTGGIGLTRMTNEERPESLKEGMMSSDVIDYYNNHVEAEWERLMKPMCAIEFASTLRMIERYFPKSGRVIDIGCGPGRYAIELRRRGYAVTLVEPAEKELDFARHQFAELGLQAEGFILGDARELGMFKDGTFDAALALGSQYHIVDREERIKALRELKRILKSSGVAIVSYLNSWGLIRTGVTDLVTRFRDRAFLQAMLGELSFPQMGGFTTCYWSTPPAARQEIADAGLEVLSYGSAEGVAGGMWPLIDKLASTDNVAYGNLVEFAAQTCELPQFRDIGDHLHYIVSK